MDVPSPQAGVVEKILIKLGDKVSEGSPIILLKGEADTKGNGSEPVSADTAALAAKQEPIAAPAPAVVPSAPVPSGSAIPDFSQVHASPSVRRIARELGVDLTAVKGTGEKRRITKEDVKGHLTRTAAPLGSAAGAVMPGGMGIPEIPAVDFSKF